MNREYEGATVFAADGERLGHVERSYIDDQGQVQMIEVKMGTILAKHRLVPIVDTPMAEDGLHLPFNKKTVEDSPDHGHIGDTIEGDTLSDVRAYYDGLGSASGPDSVVEQETVQTPVNRVGADPVSKGEIGDTGGSGEASAARAGSQTIDQSMGQMRDLGDVVEIPIVEEVLVKQPVVKEILRVRKVDLVDYQDVEADVRREELDVEQTGDVDVHERGQGNAR